MLVLAHLYYTRCGIITRDFLVCILYGGYVSISAWDLNMLLSACPTIENLVLVNPEIAMSDTDYSWAIARRLKAFILDKFILEADSLESLHLKFCALELFELLGKGALKYLKIDDVSRHMIILGYRYNNFTITWSTFFQMISGSSKLRRLRLWDVVFDEEDDILDLETISDFFPNLKYLALNYELRDDLRDGVLHYDLQGSCPLDNVVTLELGWTVINNLFTYWVSALLKRCPNLRKLVIHGVISESKTQEECQMLANFTSCIVQLMRKYIHVDVQFEYE
ncbi:hypothetical protein Leryth_004610 [Lithospermum erythrorhizon]|nr:hypothetical protein Leryth_004610 [Lithospermum erythrorhizon]